VTKLAVSRQRRRLWQLGGALALAAVVVAAIALAAGSKDGGGPPPRKPGEQLPGQFEANARFKHIEQHGFALGNPNATVTLVEFADLRCPYCRQYTTDVMPRLVAQYVVPGKLKMVFHPVAILGPDSVPAARMAAAAARQDRLWPFIDIFYANQRDETTTYVTDAFLGSIGRAVKGLDVQAALADRELPAVNRALTAAQTAFQASGATGTPTLLLSTTGGDPQLIDGADALSADAMAARIDQALKGD
jgi:protein-disulfide isomerase